MVNGLSRTKGTSAGAAKIDKNAKYIFGESKEFKDILRQMDLVAPTNYSVIIFW
jgi:two-component system response regulator HydG